MERFFELLEKHIKYKGEVDYRNIQRAKSILRFN